MTTISTASVPFRVAIALLCLVTGTAYYAFMFVVSHYIFRLSHVLGLAFALVYVLCAGIPLFYLSHSIAEDNSQATERAKRRTARFLDMLAPLPPPLFSRLPDIDLWRRILALAPAAALFSSAWAATAYGILLFFPHAYAHPEQVTDWMMSKHYLWQLVDVVPGLDAWRAIHIEDPVKEGRLWPGILVVVFRFIVLAVIVRTTAKLWKLAMHRETTETVPKAAGTVETGTQMNLPS